MPRKKDNPPKLNAVDRTVLILLHRLTPEAVRIIQMSTKESLPGFCDEFCHNIIVNFDLPQNKDLLAATGKTDPGEAALVIIEALWQKLQDEPGLGLTPPEMRVRRKRKK